MSFQNTKKNAFRIDYPEDRLIDRSAMSRRNLSISLENESTMELEESIEIGETTLRKDGLAINSAGVRMIESPDAHLVETIDHKDLKSIKVIGKGCSGQVVKVEHQKTGEYYAVKVRHFLYKNIFLSYCSV